MDLTLIEGPDETLQIINNDAVIQTIPNEAVVVETAYGVGISTGGGGVTSYNDLTDKPSTFPPTAHSHSQSDVTGLATALSGKSDTGHTHSSSAITDFNTETGMAILAATQVNGTATAGRTVLADASTSSRTVLDAGVTNASTTLTSATAAFTNADVGRPVYGLGINNGTTIASVTNATTAVMSANAYSTLTNQNLVIGSGQLNITLPSSGSSARVRVEKVDSTTRPVNLVAGSGDTIVNGGPLTVKGQSKTFLRTGTTWYAIDSFNPSVAEARGGFQQQISQGCIISATGDSIGPGFQANYGTTGGSPVSWLTWTHLYSNGKLQIGKLDAIGSTRGDMITARIHHMLAAGPAHFVVCDASYTNSASAAYTATQFIGFLKTQCDAVVASGAMPVLHTGYPVPSAYRAAVDIYRRGVIAFARRNGYILVDTYQSLYDPANGGYLSTYDSGDGIHPNNFGKQVIGKAFWQALAPYVVGFAPMPQFINDTSTGSLLSNGLFLTDSNSDGVPDGWVKAGNAPMSLVSGDSDIVGNAFRITDTANSGFTQAVTGTIANTSTGRGNHLISVTGKVRIDGAGGFNFACTLSAPSGNKVMQPVAWAAATPTTEGWKTFYSEMVAPADCNGISLVVSTGGGTNVDGRVAQIRIDDLTNGGVIV